MSKKETELINYPEWESSGIITRGPVAIRTARDVQGQFAVNFPDAHFLAVAPNFTRIASSMDHAPLRVVEWPPGTIGYCPPGMLLKGEFQGVPNTVWVKISDSQFRSQIDGMFNHSRLDFHGFEASTDPIASKLIRTLGRLADGDEQEWPLLIDSILTATSIRIAQLLGNTISEDPYPTGLPKRKLKRVLEYIDSNISRTIRLQELASVADLSPHHFARAFRRSMNAPPVHYVWRRRVERAKVLLHSAEAPLAIVAIECGFGSQSHFSTLFKKITGMTPLQFREQFAVGRTARRRRRGIALGVAGALAFGAWMRAVELFSLVDAIPV